MGDIPKELLTALRALKRKHGATAESHYRVRPLDLLRQWHIKIEAQILGMAGIEQPEETPQKLKVVK